MTMRWTIRAKLTGLVLAVLLPLIASRRRQVLARGRAGTRGRADRHDRERARGRAALRRDPERSDREHRSPRQRPRDRPHSGRGPRRPPPRGSSGITASPTGVLAARPDGEIDRGQSMWRAPRRPRRFRASTSSKVALRDAPASGRLTPAEPDGRAPGGAARRSGVRPRRSSTRRDGGRDRAAGGLGYLARVPLIHGTSAAIVTATGTLVARGGKPAVLGAAIFCCAPSAEALIRVRAGVAEWAWEGGVVNSLTAAAPMACAPGVALAAMPRDLAYAPAAKGLRRNLIGERRSAAPGRADGLPRRPLPCPSSSRTP